MKSCLLILYTNKNTDIYKSLNSLKQKRDWNISSIDYEKIAINKNESKIEISFVHNKIF